MITDLLNKNLDIVFFIYGLSFIVTAISILIYPRGKTTSRLAEVIWLLALFALIHGLNEWFDMFEIIKMYRSSIFDTIRLMCLTFSYIFLFAFGCKLILFRFKNFPYKWLMPTMCLLVFLLIYITKVPKSIWPRYLFGFPGGILSAIGFIYYYRDNKPMLRDLNTFPYFLLASISIGIYGILGGLIVPESSFFPASFINVNSFNKLIGIPVQVFRAICSIIIAWTIWNILKIFSWDLQKCLAISEKMAAIGIMSTNIAHELRTPLAVINTAVFKIEQTYKDQDETLKKDLSRITTSVQEANNIINDLLSYSKLEKLKIESIDVNAAIETALSNAAIKYQKSNILTTKRLGKIPQIEVDRTQIGVVLQNVINNSYESISNSGEITISTKYIEHGKRVEISIQDTGCGIPQEVLKKLGEPFVSNKEKGTGLGLALVFRIIKENHRGEIDIKSTVGKGTTFIIKIPVNFTS